MFVNELGPKNPDEYQLSYERAVETFELEEDFPIADHEQFRMLLNKYGQKPLYRALVDTYGRQETIENLGKLLPIEVVEIQVNVLVRE